MAEPDTLIDIKTPASAAAVSGALSPESGDAASGVNAAESSKNSSSTPAVGKQPDVSQECSEKKKPRTTWGLWAFDKGLYNAFNIAVFALSVAATYFTNVGGKKFTNLATGEKEWERYVAGDQHLVTKQAIGAEEIGKVKHDGTGGWIGRMLFRRGDWVVGKLIKVFKIDKPAAEMWKMVGFSFMDGSLLAFALKPIEDRRIKIGHWLDDHFGKKFNDRKGITEEEKEAAYAEEPKRGWWSILGGRATTFSIVFPVAWILYHTFGQRPEKETKLTKFFFGAKEEAERYIKTETGEFIPFGAKKGEEYYIKTKAGELIPKEMDHYTSLNWILFHHPGKAVGSWIDSKPGLARFFKVFGKNTDIKETFRIGFFEAFYTSVCTAGLYMWSKFFAGIGIKKKAHEGLAANIGTPLHPARNEALLFNGLAESSEKATSKEEKKEPALQAVAETGKDNLLPFKERASPATAVIPPAQEKATDEEKEKLSATLRYQVPAAKESRLEVVQQQRDKAEKHIAASPGI